MHKPMFLFVDQIFMTSFCFDAFSEIQLLFMASEMLFLYLLQEIQSIKQNSILQSWYYRKCGISFGCDAL